MPEEILRILLDQNIPQALSGWLKDKLPGWEIQHVNELGFQGRPDEFLYCLIIIDNQKIRVRKLK